MADSWIIDAALVYDKGSIRKNNEDSYYFDGKHAALKEMDQTEQLQKTGKAAGSLWAVCDGMGGQSNGEVASYTAVSGMRELQRHLQGREFETTIQSWVHQASDAVHNKADGGTTMVMLYCSEKYLQTAHVGDSRIYRLHDGTLSRLTRDHSKVEMMVSAGIITEAEAETHPQRHTITRYLGMDSEYVCDATVGEKIPYTAGDRFLLCSDGITDMMNDEKLESILKTAKNSHECAEQIRNEAFAAGARDNLTLIVLEIKLE